MTSLPHVLTKAVCDQNFIDSIDLTVGTAGSKAELTHLQKVMDLPLAEPTALPLRLNLTQNFSALSVQDGLISLAVLGKESIFNQPGASGYSIEIEDLVTLHATGDSIYAQLVQLISSAGNGFKVVTDVTKNTGSLVASTALTKLCPTTQPSSMEPTSLGSCLLRFDIQARTPVTDLAYEVQPNQEVAASAFMKNVLGSNSDFAGALGSNFSYLLAAEYQLMPGGKARRVFWINPGITWSASSAASRFILSQHVVLVALVHLVTNIGSSRRSLLAMEASSLPTSSSAGASVAAVQFGTSLRDIMAAALDLPLDHVGWWKIDMALSDDQACKASADLSANMRQIFMNYLVIAATGVDQVGIQSVAVNTGTVACSGLRRNDQRVSQGGATAAFDTIVAFNSSTPFLSMSTLLKMPSVISVVAVIVPAAIGGDSTDVSVQHMPESGIFISIGAVIVALLMFIVLRRFQNKDNIQKSSEKPCYSIESTEKKVDCNVSSRLTTHNRKEYLEPACVSATLGFMMPDVEKGLGRSLDGLRRSIDLVSAGPKPAQMGSPDFDLLRENEKRADHAQPAHIWGSFIVRTSQPTVPLIPAKPKIVPKVQSDIVKRSAKIKQSKQEGRCSSRSAGEARRAAVTTNVIPPDNCDSEF